MPIPGNQRGPIDGGERASLPAIRGHQTLEELAYEALRRAITRGRLRPGERISVNEMAQQLGVSRLPVIHAMRRLASEGFVVIRPHRDALVANPSPDEIKGRYLIMAELEGLAIREAAARLSPADLDDVRRNDEEFRTAFLEPIDPERGVEADHAFHSILWRAAGIQQLSDLIETLWAQGSFDRYLLANERLYIDTRLEEHERILRALQAAAPEELAAAVREHRLNGLSRVIELLSALR